MYTIRQLNYFKAVYWDVVLSPDDDGVGLFGTPEYAQAFADKLNQGEPVSSIYDNLLTERG